MGLILNISILILLRLFGINAANLPLNLYHHNYYPQVHPQLYSSHNHGHDQSLILSQHNLEHIPTTTATAVIKEKPASTNLFLQILRLLWNRRFGKTVETTTVKEIPEPVIIQQPVPLYLPQPYPVTRTLIKEVPVKVKEYVPIKVPVHNRVVIPHHTLIQQHDIQPTVTKIYQPTITKVIETTTTKIIEPSTTEPTPTTPSETEPPINTEKENKPVIVEKEVMETENIITPPPTKTNEYGLPSVTLNVPFNEYGLPLEESDRYQMFYDNSISSYDVSDTPIPISGKSSDGEYHNSYVLDDGTRVTEKGKIIKGKGGNDVLVKKGNYEFVDEKGKIVKVDWVADELGFRILDN